MDLLYDQDFMKLVYRSLIFMGTSIKVSLSAKHLVLLIPYEYKSIIKMPSMVVFLIFSFVLAKTVLLEVSLRYNLLKNLFLKEFLF